MQNLHEQYKTRETPQSEPIPGRETEMTQNSAGGFVFAVDDMARFERFLILGTEGGTYYVGEKQLSKDNISCLHALLKAGRGIEVVAKIVDVSVKGRAPKNDTALFALAFCAGNGDPATKKAALDALPQVARIGTHLYHFAEYVEAYRGWGRSLRGAVAKWYTNKPNDKLAYDLIKYRQRDGWSHRDLLRLSHPVTSDPVKNALFKGVVSEDFAKVRGLTTAVAESSKAQMLVAGFEEAQLASTPAETAALVRQFRLPREALRTEHLTSPEVWTALFESGMPMTALIRNLANMTRAGVLGPLGTGITNEVIAQITDAKRLRSARVHPISLLFALKTYQSGTGFRSSNTWTPVPKVVAALEDAFYASFENVEPTGKAYLLALDVSGSMGFTGINGSSMLPCEVTAAMAMLFARTEAEHYVMGFSKQFVDLKVTPKDSLQSAMDKVVMRNFGSTDCAVPFNWGTQTKTKFDIAIVMTDNETWAGERNHPTQAITTYREQVNPTAKMAVLATSATNFTIADPNDRGQLDIAGFDPTVPAIIRSFVLGEV